METHLNVAIVFMTVSVCSSTLMLLPPEELGVLQIHNRLRRDYANGRYGVLVANMKQMKWSSALATRAKRFAKCRNANRLVRLERPNVNVAISQSTNSSELVYQWFNGHTDFSTEYSVCLQKGKCTNFKTIVTANNYRIGCAYSPSCWEEEHEFNLFVCLYAGSKRDEYPIFKTGEPCSKCTGTTSFCDDGLCISCPGRNRICDCRKTCGRSGVGSGYLDERTCTCSCAYGMGPNCDEVCENPEQYEDWDVCADVTPDDCDDPDEEVRKMYDEFCPEKCSCRKHPGLV